MTITEKEPGDLPQLKLKPEIVELNPGVIEKLGVEASDNHLIVETRRYAEQFPPSALEEAFDAEIQRRFHTALFEPKLDEFNRLVRVSYPVTAGDSLVAFQYSRRDLIQTNPYTVTKLLLPHNPILQGTLDEYPETHDADLLDYGENFIGALTKRIIERDGKLDSYRALSDPTYYTEGTPLTQWPESYEFVIFHPGNEIAQHVPPTQIKGQGRLAGKRASVYGRLKIPASFDTYANEAKLTVKYPQLYYETILGYTQSITEVNPDDYRYNTLDIDDFGEIPCKEFPLYISQDPEGRGETMRKIGAFVSKLTHQHKEE